MLVAGAVIEYVKEWYEPHTPIQSVSERLGHSRIKVTVDTYGHPRQGTHVTLVDRLDYPGADAVPYATPT